MLNQSAYNAFSPPTTSRGYGEYWVSIICYHAGNGPVLETIPFLAAIRGSRFSACEIKFDSLSISSTQTTNLNPLSISILSNISSSLVHLPHDLQARSAGSRVVGTLSNFRINSVKKGEVIVKRVWDNASCG